MNNITYFVAPRGEGKTRWLRERAIDEFHKGNKVYIYANSSFRYRIFIEEFYESTGEICHVLCINKISEVPTGSVLLIDNLVDSRISTEDLEALAARCSYLYITLEGNSGNKHQCTCKKNCKEEI